MLRESEFMPPFGIQGENVYLRHKEKIQEMIFPLKYK